MSAEQLDVSETKSAREYALDGLPTEWRENLIEAAARMGVSPGIDGENDVAWFMIRAYGDAIAAAKAASDAAMVAAEGVAQTPKLIEAAAYQARDIFVQAVPVIAEKLDTRLDEKTDAAAGKIRSVLNEIAKSAGQEVLAAHAQGAQDMAVAHKAFMDYERSGIAAYISKLDAKIEKLARPVSMTRRVAAAVGAVVLLALPSFAAGGYVGFKYIQPAATGNCIAVAGRMFCPFGANDLAGDAAPADNGTTLGPPLRPMHRR